MGLPRGTTDVDGRRTNPIYGSDTGYRTYLTAMAARPYEQRQEMKDSWADGMALVGTKEVRELAGSSKKISQQKIFDMYIRGDAEGLKGLGIKLSKEDEAKLKERGNILGEQVNPQYESLEGTISRIRR
jgi:hypothetical protein